MTTQGSDIDVYYVERMLKYLQASFGPRVTCSVQHGYLIIFRSIINIFLLKCLEGNVLSTLVKTWLIFLPDILLNLLVLFVHFLYVFFCWLKPHPDCVRMNLNCILMLNLRWSIYLFSTGINCYYPIIKLRIFIFSISLPCFLIISCITISSQIIPWISGYIESRFRNLHA